MRKLVVLVALLALLPAVSASADAIYVGQKIYFSDGPGGGQGGSFAVNLNNTVAPPEFYTFCVQLNETIYVNNTEYRIGGIGTVTAAADPDLPLTPEVAWLYTKYRTGQLGVLDENGHSALQAAIWAGMGYTLAQYGAYDGTYLQSVVDNWHTQFLASNWQGVGDVRILNIVSPAGVNAQDVLAMVPEPGSMLLLGTGLVGLAGAIRRRIRK